MIIDYVYQDWSNGITMDRYSIPFCDHDHDYWLCLSRLIKWYHNKQVINNTVLWSWLLIIFIKTDLMVLQWPYATAVSWCCKKLWCSCGDGLGPIWIFQLQRNRLIDFGCNGILQHLKQKTILLTTTYLIRNWSHWHRPNWWKDLSI